MTGRITLLVSLLLPAAGCETARYQYTIEVESEIHRSQSEPAISQAIPPATVTVSILNNHGIEVNRIEQPSGATTFDMTEVLAFLNPFVPSASGITVNVEQAGSKPWQATYTGWDFVRDAHSSYRRIDVVRMEPTSSTQPSSILASAPQRHEHATHGGEPQQADVTRDHIDDPH